MCVCVRAKSFPLKFNVKLFKLKIRSVEADMHHLKCLKTKFEVFSRQMNGLKWHVA